MSDAGGPWACVPTKPRIDGSGPRKWAVKIWREAVPLQRGDMVWRYLAEREIDLERWERATSPPVNEKAFPALPRVSPGFWGRPDAREYYVAPVITCRRRTQDIGRGLSPNSGDSSAEKR
jgi:hypothetical protein